MRLFVSKWKNVLKGIPTKGRIRRLSDATGWPMINFKVTKTAKEMLKEMIRKSETEHGYNSLVPAILWGSDVGKKDFEWGVGFYERSRIVADWIVVLD